MSKPAFYPQRNRNLAILALLAFALIVFLGKSYEVTLRGIDSNIHAAVSMNVTSHGAVPLLPMPYSETGGIFNDHPFTLFWVNGWIMRALGPTAFSARLLTALFGVASVYLTYLIGEVLVGSVYALLAGLFLVTCRDFVLTSGTMSLDTALAFFILLSFYLWLTGKKKAAGVAAGIGLWVKTPIVLLLYPTLGIHSFLRRRIREEFVPLFTSFVIAIALGAAFWVFCGFVGGWEMVRDYWVRQLWGTAVEGRGSPDHQWTFFFYTVRTGFLPGLPFLIVALARAFWNGRWRATFFAIPLIATGIVGLVVTLMRFKLGHYFTPIFPFLSLMAAYSISEWLKPRAEKFRNGFIVFTLVLSAVLLCAPIPLAPEALLALSRFEPYIQRFGSCSDRVMLVPGGEPVGSTLDYRLHLVFYTGRKVVEKDCASLADSIRKDAPEWLLISSENLKVCLPADARSKFQASLQLGNQNLLSRVMTEKQAADLTPLNTSGLAVTDCQAPPYPRDLWHRYE